MSAATHTSSATDRTAVRAVAAAVWVALLLALTVPSAPGSTPSVPVDVIVTVDGAIAGAVDAVRDVGGEITGTIEAFGIATATVPADAIPALEARVADVALDERLTPESTDADEGIRAPSTTAAASIGATALHAAGITGEGVGIAVVDTGIDPIGPLKDALVAGAAVVGPGKRGDAHGHGTFVAGILSGDGGEAAGVAPGAHLVAIKVADDDGATSLSALLHGLALTHDAREQLGVRVVLLAFGVTPGDGDEPLRRALQTLWADGLTVVVPAGNDGPGTGTMTSPGTDPYLLTVGASDDQGTVDRGDDTVASLSGRGPAPERVGPDVLAPGVSLLSMRSPGSLVDRTYKTGRVGPRGFRGSGTSMAASVVAGAAALLLQADGSLTPDEVKGRLVASAVALEGADPTAAGAGLVDVVGARAADGAVANTHLPVLPAPEWPEAEAGGPAVPTGNNWVGNNWVGNNWVGNNWVGNNWVGNNWVGNNWVGNNWVGNNWVGNNWVGNNWVGNNWVGATWSADHWLGHNWLGHNWAGSWR